MKKTALMVSLLLLFTSTLIHANSRKAPEWDISEWINGQGVTLSELAGKVVVVEFFQLWCPGCKSYSTPDGAVGGKICHRDCLWQAGHAEHTYRIRRTRLSNYTASA